MINLFLRLFAAHLVADFFLQFDCINKGKYCRGFRGFLFLFLHGFIHAIVTYLLLAQWDNWFIPLFIFTTHILTDWAKVVFTNRFCPNPNNSGVLPFLLSVSSCLIPYSRCMLLLLDVGPGSHFRSVLCH